MPNDLKKIEKELLTDKKKYFENCKQYYSEYVSIAQKLFPEIYQKMNKIDEDGNPWSKFNSKAIELRNNQDAEIKLLEEAIEEKVYTPGTYERLAVLYGKKKKYVAAYRVCEKWFESDYWKIPNTANGSLRIMKRMEQLEKKLNDNGG